MTTHGSHEPIPQEAIERDHEQRDLSLGMLAGSLVALALVTAAAIVAMALLLGWFNTRAVNNDPAPSPIGRADVTPPQPRLERTPAELRKQHEADLAYTMNSYGWLERDASVARIPVARAMEILAREGLPSRVDMTEAAGAAERE
jgi:hypothetical protein